MVDDGWSNQTYTLNGLFFMKCVLVALTDGLTVFDLKARRTSLTHLQKFIYQKTERIQLIFIYVV